jgi:pyruvate/2-oxoglutarate/acetoin dehydrogenase E1 component
MEMTYAAAITETLRRLLREDKRVVLLGEDIGTYGGAFRITKGFLKEFGPERVIETPISEGSVMGVAVGMAMRGMRPVIEIMFMDFITLCMDQILNHGAKFPAMFGMDIPVVVRTPAGGGRGYGPTHSQSLESLLNPIPGIEIVAPATPQDACGLLQSAVASPRITIFVEGKTLYGVKGEVALDAPAVPIGTAAVARPGRDITITAFGRMVPETLRAAGLLAQTGVEAEVIDLRTVKPLDMDTVAASVEKTSRLVTVEEGPLTGGIGAEIAASVFERAFFALDAPIRRVAAADGPVPASPALEKKHLPDAERIAAAVREVLAANG